MALRANRLSARVRGPKRAARRSRLHHPRFACSVRARRNRKSISITHGGTCNPRWKPNCNRRGSHRWPGWEGIAMGTTSCLVLKMEQCRGLTAKRSWSPALRKRAAALGPPLSVPGGNGGRCTEVIVAKSAPSPHRRLPWGPTISHSGSIPAHKTSVGIGRPFFAAASAKATEFRNKRNVGVFFKYSFLKYKWHGRWNAEHA